jgi:glycine amidinotransferase/scyllo-inosamine-4-phosphate amidinotransferase 1
MAKSLVKVYNEWDPLEEVIIGTTQGAQVPIGDKGLFSIRYSDYDNSESIPSGPHNPKILEEAQEDLDIFIDVIKKAGVTIRRPAPTDQTKIFGTPDWKSDGMYNYCPRDVMIAFDDMIIETPMSLRSRMFETFAYKDILIEYLKSGARWISAPKPRLLDEIYNTTDPSKLAVRELEPVFDAANTLRVGRDIIYLVSDTGNELGALWLQSILGDKFRVHPCKDLYASTHIDTTITLLRPGLVLVNPSRVNDKNLPAIFKKWKVLKGPEPIDVGFTGVAYGSAWISLNLFMMAPDLAVVERSQTPLIKLLEANGITCIPLRWRHGRTLGGGFHCVTLDVRRKGTLEDYTL